jgi:phosphoribosyl-ATP pyrophosphohydrolase/phosphoribosyl-AMP cyclohydrolase/histidinol dehydrogenase
MVTLGTTLLPLLDALPSPALLGVVSRAAPLLVPLHLLPDVLPLLPPTLPYIVHVTAINTPAPDALADLLDAGAEALLLDADTPPALALLGGNPPASLPAARILLHLPADSPAAAEPGALQGLAGLVVALPADSAAGSEAATAIAERFGAALGAAQSGKPVYLAPSGTLSPGAPAAVASLEDVASAAKAGASVVARTSALALLSEGQEAPAGSLDFIGALLAPLNSDRADGHFPTTVVSASLSTSLGLVYSSCASIRESLLTGAAVYQSRKRGLWRKGETSGATQEVVRVRFDCDADAVEFRVRQRAGAQHAGFCHLTQRDGCFGPQAGLAALESTLLARKAAAPPGSYTARLFSDPALLGAKLREEAAELAEAKDEDPQHVAFEAADLLYFALARCIRAGVGLEQVEASLDRKAKKVIRRTGDAKPQFAAEQAKSSAPNGAAAASAPAKKAEVDPNAPIKIQSYKLADISASERVALLKRPALKSAAIQELVRPILAAVKERGDAALLELTEKFDKAKLSTPMVQPPFATEAVMKRIKPEVKRAMDQAYANIHAFHLAQKRTGGNAKAADVGSGGVVAETGEEEEDAVLEVETMPGVVCRRFARPIERVGLYVPGGTAVLPSTALMLGVPAQVAKCPVRIIATPPRPDGSIAPEVLYAAHLVGATAILAAGGAQAVGALAYGTDAVPKVDKICGPGNQFVTAAKLLVQNDMDACVSIDMPAGPSEVLVIADATSNPDFVASDLLSQAEHGPDSQVVLVAIDLTDAQLDAIETAIDRQAKALPRCAYVRQAIEKSVTIRVPNREEAMRWSNDYAPEHLIIQTDRPEELAKATINAGSIFVGQWSPESCGDYASGTNHSLPTNAFAR